MSFVRRYGFFPGTEIITQIEGIIIVDTPPPGAISGVGTGTVAIVGEFADMAYAVQVNPTTGAVSTKARPVEIFSGQDLLNKVGGWDETLGDTGLSGGNGLIAVRNKQFTRLVLVPINLCSPLGVRLYRDLPTNVSAASALPVTVVSSSTVAAGREFKTTTHRVRLGTSFTFTGLGQYAQGTDGAITAAGSAAASQTFVSAGAQFNSAKNGGPVQAGDLLVLGKIGGAGALGANAGTYRIVSVTDDTDLVVEKLDGSSFDWTTGTAQPYRIHPSSDADSGGQVAASGASGYVLPARPLDASVSASTTLTPTLTPPAATDTTWDPLSNLHMRTSPTSPGLAYDANVQAANAASSADLDALYSTAVDALLTDDLPARDVNILVLARHSSTLAAKQKSHVLSASANGVGRITTISPPLSTQATSDAIADSYPGVGGNRDERVIYAWPGAQTFVQEAVGFNMIGADGFATADGMLDTHLDAWAASVMSVLPPERNPAQSGPPVTAVMAPVLAFQRGVSGLGQPDYVQFRARGVMALRFDRSAGPMFQSGVTTSLTSGQKNINRRRMADFIEDSLADALQPFNKQPLTDALKDAAVGEIDAFMKVLLSPNNPPAQRIAGYLIDDKSGNTPDTEAMGIYVIIVRVRTLSTADFIVLQAEVGENVTVTAQ